jgi:hypothetical protein
MSKSYLNPVLFNPSSPSLVTSSALADSTVTSIYTTTTTRTIPGIGSLSGKFIHGFGKAVLRGVDSVIIRRRLTYLESVCPLFDERPPNDIEQIYADLLEMARQVIIHMGRQYEAELTRIIPTGRIYTPNRFEGERYTWFVNKLRCHKLAILSGRWKSGPHTREP